MQMKRIILFSALSILFIASLILNFYLWMKPINPVKPKSNIITFSNANSRDTYFTLHNVRAAHLLSTGRGVKVGITDCFFGYAKYSNLYEGAVNFTQDQRALDGEGHGFWMANTLREIAPDCDIYALCVDFGDEGKKADNMVAAIDWAIENNIDILTYSSSSFSEKNRPKIDEAADKAVQHGIVTTFIHYDNPNNLFPGGFSEFSEGNRETDVNILHYDYNVIMQERYEKFAGLKGDYSQIKSGDDIPFLSMSSTSPVLAGFVAILKAIKPDLSPGDYKDILMKTSYRTEYYDWGWGRYWSVPRAVDIARAAAYAISLRSTEIKQENENTSSSVPSAPAISGGKTPNPS